MQHEEQVVSGAECNKDQMAFCKEEVEGLKEVAAWRTKVFSEGHCFSGQEVF